jgi:hypothetical protein
MTKRTRRNHTPGLKAKVALAAMKGDNTLACKIACNNDPLRGGFRVQ